MSQKEWEKALHEYGGMCPDAYADALAKIKTRIELVGYFADIKKLAELPQELRKPSDLELRTS